MYTFVYKGCETMERTLKVRLHASKQAVLPQSPSSHCNTSQLMAVEVISYKELFQWKLSIYFLSGIIVYGKAFIRETALSRRLEFYRKNGFPLWELYYRQKKF